MIKRIFIIGALLLFTSSFAIAEYRQMETGDSESSSVLDETQLKIAKLEQTVKYLEDMIDSYRRESHYLFERSAEMVGRQNCKIDVQQLKIDDQQSKIDVLVKEDVRLSGLIESQNSKIDDQQLKVNDQQLKVNDLLLKINDQQNKVTDQQNKVNALVTEDVRLSGLIESLNSRLTHVQADLAKHNDHIFYLQRDLIFHKQNHSEELPGQNKPE